MQKKSLVSGFLVVLLGLLISAGAGALPTQQMTILHTNDFHGRLLPYNHIGWILGVDDQPVGGIARRATLISQLRGESSNPVALVDAGDFFVAGPWQFLFQGLPEVEAMNLMGYDVMSVGNHELEDFLGDQALSHLLSLAQTSNFSWLSANLTSSDTGEAFPEIPPYVVKNYGNLRVGFLGLTTTDYWHSTIGGCELSDPLNAAAYWVPVVRQQCDVLIVVSHLGLSADNELAATVSGIDAIIGGHSHDFLDTPDWVENPLGVMVPIFQAGEYGLALGRCDLSFTQQDGAWRLTSASGELIPITKDLAEDQTVVDLLASYGIESPPQKEFSVPRLTPTIDGNLQEWAGEIPMQIGVGELPLHYQLWGGAQDLSASAWLSWDSDYIYFAADVTDESFHQEQPGESIWQQDSLQLAFDPLFDRYPGAYQADEREYWFAYEDGETLSYCYQGEILGERPDITAKAKLKSDGSGWTLEVALPWSELGVSPRVGLQMGSSWLANDFDTGDSLTDDRYDWLEWTPGVALNPDPASFGVITLAGEHTLSVTASANPSSLASGGATHLTATAEDSFGHEIASWSWSDHGAGGTFSPSAGAQNPVYTAPGNYTDAAVERYLTVTATCEWEPQIAAAAGMYLIEDCASHTFNVTATATPSTVASGGTTQLNAAAEDSFDHGVAAWAWSDNGAGGTFSPSASVQNPTWTAPANHSGVTLHCHLTVTAICDGDEPLSDSAQVYVNESSSSHYITVSASATPGVIASGSSTSLRATARDSAGHTITGWAWDDNGAGGTFSPSADVQNPTYTGPGNDTQAPVTRTLTVTATCTEGVCSFGSVALRENPAPHNLAVTASADPSNIASEGETQLSASAEDNYGHDIAGWSWSDHGAGGVFTPSADVQNPIYTGPGNSSQTPAQRHLSVPATCDGASVQSGTAEVYVWEGSLPNSSFDFPVAGKYLFSLPLKNPDRTDGRWVLRDLLSDPDAVVTHTDPGTGDPIQIATWSAVAQAYTYGTLDDLLSPGQGYFLEVTDPCSLSLTGVAFELYSYVQAEWNLLGAPSIAVDFRNLASTGQPLSGPWAWNTALQDYEQSYLLEPGQGYWVKFASAGTVGVPPAETAARLNSAATLQSGEKPYLANASTLMEFSDVPARHWAHAGAQLMRWLAITGGWNNDNALNKTGKVTPAKKTTGFKPGGDITRGQLAVFLCRAFDLPLSPAPQLKYSDIPAGYWGAGYIEAVSSLGIMGEYSGKPGCFCLKQKVTRAELVAALARAAGLPLVKPASQVFSDVPAYHWAASEIAALSAQGAFQGEPGIGPNFKPDKAATRAELALYLYHLLNSEVK
jgi:hypothetical protein